MSQLAGSMSEEDVVLLVDDDPSNLAILRETLKARPYRLLMAKSGEQALSIATKAQPALVLLDIMMPGIDGFETCRRLYAQAETENVRLSFCRHWMRRKTRFVVSNLAPSILSPSPSTRTR